MNIYIAVLYEVTQIIIKQYSWGFKPHYYTSFTKDTIFKDFFEILK